MNQNSDFLLSVFVLAAYWPFDESLTDQFISISSNRLLDDTYRADAILYFSWIDSAFRSQRMLNTIIEVILDDGNTDNLRLLAYSVCLKYVGRVGLFSGFPSSLHFRGS